MLKSSSNNGDRDDREELNEPDYDEDEDQLEEKQQEEAVDIAVTTNEVF